MCIIFRKIYTRTKTIVHIAASAFFLTSFLLPDALKNGNNQYAYATANTALLICKTIFNLFKHAVCTPN